MCDPQLVLCNLLDAKAVKVARLGSGVNLRLVCGLALRRGGAIDFFVYHLSTDGVVGVLSFSLSVSQTAL
jgi:hypothetical protein